ncbi:MAG: hypothetical protein ABEL76_12200 [Bradymonadaceae bacterium]
MRYGNETPSRSLLIAGGAVCALCLGAPACSSGGGGDGGGSKRDTGPDAQQQPDGTEGEDGGGADAGPDTGRDVTAAGFAAMPPRPTSCTRPGKIQRIPFYFRNTELTPIAAGDRIFGATLRANQTVGAGTLDARQMRVSPANRGACSGASCTSPYKCGSTGLRGTQRHCTRPSGVSFVPGSAQMDYEANRGQGDGQLVTILMENSNMWKGQLPRIVNGKFDEDGERDFREKPARASDPKLMHRRAISKFSEFLKTSTVRGTTRVSFWFFAGQVPARVRPIVPAGEFTEDLTAPKSLLESEESVPSPAPRPSNLYQAIEKVVDKELGLPKFDGKEKFLVVLTDGPNEVFDSDATRQKVLETLKAHDVHLFMLHLDASIDPSLLRDLPTYWQGNAGCQSDPSCDGAPTCQSDADCANFETCRRATIYADEKSESVRKTKETYCMPDYSEKTGRLGPIGPFADFACQTRGHYIYTTDPKQLVWYARKLPFLLDGQWSVEAEISAFDDEVGLEGGFYRMSGFVSGLLGPNLTTIWSDVGGGVAHPVDSRPVVRLGSGE